jgi:hypothetical protein
MPRSRQGFAVALTSLVTALSAIASAPTDEPATLEAPLEGLDFFNVSRADPDGTIVLGLSSSIPDQFRDKLGSAFAEGLYLLFTTDAKDRDKHALVRVQVTDVGEGSVLTLKAGARAAARVQEGDLARLLRPSPITTARLRALPDEIPFAATALDRNPDVVREAKARSLSINNLTRIGLAIHNFYATFDRFPPAVIYGPDGKPWHSWRVMILPWLEEMEIYRAYDFSQPWDSPKNKALLDKMPAVYRDPKYGDTKDNFTHYAALVGPGAVFRPEGAKQIDPANPPFNSGGMGLASITDGTSNTVMISSVEPQRKLPWTKPEDIDVGAAFKGVGQPGGIAAPYLFRGPGGGKAAPFLFADATVRMIGASVNPKTLAALITRAGGEVIPSDSYPTEPSFSDVRTKVLKIHLAGANSTATIELQAAAPTLPTVPKALRKGAG